jgi:hypothetical protein
VKWDSVKWVVGEIFVGEMYPNRISSISFDYILSLFSIIFH